MPTKTNLLQTSLRKVFRPSETITSLQEKKNDNQNMFLTIGKKLIRGKKRQAELFHCCYKFFISSTKSNANFEKI